MSQNLSTVLAAFCPDADAEPLAHLRQRITGKVGVLESAGEVLAICAHHLELTRIPPAVIDYDHLYRLDVGANQLTELPAIPMSLRELFVDDNQLLRLPSLPPLRVLDANRNRLIAIPALVGIEFVYVASNQLTAPPKTSGVR